MSSLVRIQLKWIQEVWLRPVTRYSPRKYAEIECVLRKDVRNGRVKMPAIFTDGQLNGKNTYK